MQVWDGNAWVDPPIATKDLDGVGIATGYDSTNRLSVRSQATLLSHDGTGHQLKINKASASDTASLLFQSNWTGHAEMGLSGNNGFAIKLSPDGGSWTDALSFDPSTGAASGAAVQACADDTTTGRLMRADFGYGPGNLLGTVSESGGTPTGAVIERGSTSNGEFVRNADGALFASNAAIWDFPAAFATGAPVAISGSRGASNRFVAFDGPTETEVEFKVLATANDATTLIPSAIAVGRWF